MNRSDWIALAACIVTFLGIIPPFYQILTTKKIKKKNDKPAKEQVTASPDLKIEPENQKVRPLYNAFIQTIAAVLIFLIELIVFSWLAYVFDVKVDISTMPLNWLIGFYALLVIPGLLLFFALNWVLSVMEF
jgi:hypothetical protein